MPARAVAVLITLTACRANFDLLATRVDANTGSGSTDAVIPVDAPDGDAADQPNRAFVTSTRHAANFGGIAAADQICQMRADAAGLGGTFIALLGDASRPEPRLAGARGWVDVLGAPIVDEPATWLDGYMFTPLNRDETGTNIGYDIAWIGSIYACTGWTSTLATENGSVVTTGDAFGAYTVTDCAATNRFVCAETAHVATVTPPLVTGRIAFLTVAGWTPGGGLTGADALCATEATAQSLPGSYRALLTTSTQDAFARVSLTGPTWTRVDRIALTPTAADLASDTLTWLDAFPHVRSDGTRYPYAGLWTGDATANCSNWMSSSSGQTGLVGGPAMAYRSLWRAVATVSCDIARSIVCLQE